MSDLYILCDTDCDTPYVKRCSGVVNRVTTSEAFTSSWITRHSYGLYFMLRTFESNGLSLHVASMTLC